MTYLFAIIAILLIVFVFYRSKGSRKKEDSPATAASTDAQEDEYLYDPKTGKRITLEQAMEGYEVEQEENEQLVPEEKPAQTHTEEEVAVLRIRNWVILENFGLVTAAEANALLNEIRASRILQSYGDKMEYLFAAAPDPGIQLMVMQVSPELGHSREGSELGEHQLMGVLKLEYFSGDALLVPKRINHPLLTALTTGHSAATDKQMIYTNTDDVPHQLLQLDDALEGLTNYFAEVHQEFLILKSNQPATVEEADDLLKCLRTLKRILNN